MGIDAYTDAVNRELASMNVVVSWTNGPQPGAFVAEAAAFEHAAPAPIEFAIPPQLTQPERSLCLQESHVVPTNTAGHSCFIDPAVDRDDDDRRMQGDDSEHEDEDMEEDTYGES